MSYVLKTTENKVALFSVNNLHKFVLCNYNLLTWPIKTRIMLRFHLLLTRNLLPILPTQNIYCFQVFNLAALKISLF